MPGWRSGASKFLGMKMIKIPAYGMIHLVTSKNAPALHLEFNETWILSDGNLSDDDSVIMKSYSKKVSSVKTFE